MLRAAHERGVERVIVIGTDPDDSRAACDFAAQHEGIYWTYGCHPSETARLSEVKESVFRVSISGVQPEKMRSIFPACNANSKNASLTDKLVAIGEIGLDYHYEPFDREAQIQLFEQQLQLAQDLDLPVSFHIREAFDDFWGVMANFPKVRGVVHSFSDNKKNLRKILEGTDFYVGVNGMATYSTLPTPPLERVLLETDAPFLAPVPHRGEQNQPAYVADVAEWLAQKTNRPLSEITEVTTANAEKLFRF